MSLARGGHHGDLGNCTATDPWQAPAQVNIHFGNLNFGRNTKYNLGPTKLGAHEKLLRLH
jgi:hypothetical protein